MPHDFLSLLWIAIEILIRSSHNIYDFLMTTDVGRKFIRRKFQFFFLSLFICQAQVTMGIFVEQSE